MDLRYQYEQVIKGLPITQFLVDLIVILTFVVLWFIVGLIAVRIVKRSANKWMKKEGRSPRSITITKLLISISRYTIWFVVFVFILAELNIAIAPLLASAGILGLAIGFGSQEIVKDFISGFFIIFEGSFSVNDVIEVDGFKGTVLSLGLRTTKILNWKGEVKIINNGSIRGVINFSKEKSIAIVDFGVAYNTDLEKLKIIMEEYTLTLQEKYPVIMEKPSFLGVQELADSSINVRIIAKTLSNEHHQVQRNIRKEVVELLREKGIEIPFPHVVIVNDK